MFGSEAKYAVRKKTGRKPDVAAYFPGRKPDGHNLARNPPDLVIESWPSRRSGSLGIMPPPPTIAAVGLIVTVVPSCCATMAIDGFAVGTTCDS